MKKIIIQSGLNENNWTIYDKSAYKWSVTLF